MSYLISLRLIDRSADRITGAPPPCAPPPQPRGQLVRSGAWRNTDADRHERPGALPAGSDECIEQEWARLERCCGLYTRWDFMPKSARIWQWTITYLETVGVRNGNNRYCIEFWWGVSQTSSIISISGASYGAGRKLNKFWSSFVDFMKCLSLPM